MKGPKNLQSTPQWRAIEEQFLATGDAAPVEKALTLARDESVVEAYRAAIEPAFPQAVAMLAGGAYGRGQTFPYSELDIVLLLDSGKQSEALKEMLPEFVRLLWNAGLRLNSAVLTIAECLEAVERASVAASACWTGGCWRATARYTRNSKARCRRRWRSTREDSLSACASWRGAPCARTGIRRTTRSRT